MGTRQPETRPNILLLHTDQQRWDALGANENEEIRTPNLDRLADNGVNLPRTFVNAPVCMPSRQSYLTGRYPSELRIFQNGVSLPGDVRTLPEYFGGYGYTTANLGKLHFRPHANRDHSQVHPDYGFDHLELSDEPGCYEDAYRAWVRDRAPDQLDEISVGLPPAAETWQTAMGRDDDIDHPSPRFTTEPRAFPGDPAYTHTAFVARRTMRYLERHADDRFLCVSGFYSPHSPWVAPQRFLDQYDPADLSIPDYPAHLEAQREDAPTAGDGPATPQYTDAELRRVRRGYYAMVSEVDHWVGEILDSLEALDLLDETLVIFTSDHGEDLGQHCRYGKGFPGWDSVSRVPMLVHWPDGVENPGRTERGITELVDLLPTLLEVAGLPVPSDLQGESFLAALADEGYAGRESALLEHCDGRAVRTDRYRYALEPDGEERLYDLDSDPEEFHDVSADPGYGDALSECRGRLARRTTEVALSGARPAEWPY